MAFCAWLRSRDTMFSNFLHIVSIANNITFYYGYYLVASLSALSPGKCKMHDFRGLLLSYSL